MIGLFPSPLPDEILYSICARYSKRVNYPNSKFLLEELFGNRNSKAIFDFPCNLLAFCSALLPNLCYSVETIINNQTLLPYYSMFISSQKLKQIKHQMIYSNGNGLHFRLGLMATKIKLPSYLRLCKSCLIDDLEEYGEIFWHRSHQLPGVLYCWKHEEILNESNIKIVGAESNQIFQLLELTTKSKTYIINKKWKNKLIKLAKTSYELLSKNYSSLEKKELQEKYLPLLMRKNLVSKTGSLFVNKILNAFLNFYPADFLKILGCEFTGNNIYEDNWLLRILRKQSSQQHPLYHLLLIDFLGLTLEEFVNLEPLDNPIFGQAPWYCLNQVAKHFKQKTITELKISERSRNGKIAGHFKCKCGFEYIRSGPTITESDNFRIDKMVNFGTIWENRLVELWNDSSINLTKISQTLGVDSLTVKKYAIKLNLSFSRGKKNYKILTEENCLKKQITDNFNILLELKRKEWSEIRQTSSNLELKELRKEHSKTYNWLFRNDSKWLKNHLPKKRKTTVIKKTPFINWKETRQFSKN